MLAVLVSASSLIASCTKTRVLDAPATVRIDADPGVRAATTRVHVQMFGGASFANLSSTPALDATYDVGGTAGADGGVATTWPLSLAVAPRGGDTQRVYRVVVEGLDASNARTGYAQVISGFLPNRALLSTVYLDDACGAPVLTCGPTTTCRGGTCVSAVVIPTTLPTVCRPGQGEFQGRCVDQSACGTTFVCGANSSCAVQFDGFLCACDAGLVHDGAGCVTPVEVCPLLTAPTNGTVDRATGGAVGDVITYGCNLGYALSGTMTRMCAADGWSGVAPTCTGQGPTFSFAITSANARAPYGGFNYVDVSIDRVSGFSGAIDVVAVTPPTGLVTETLSIPAGATTGRFRITASGALTLGTAFTLKLRATSGAIVQDATVSAVVTGQPGAFDASFGAAGSFQWSMVYKGSASIFDIRESASAKLLVGGFYMGGLGGTVMYGARLLDTGALDASFNSAGTVPGVFTVAPCSCTGRSQQTHAILRQQNGFVLMVGNAGVPSTTTSDDVAIQRLKDDGTADNVGNDLGMAQRDLGGSELVRSAILDAAHAERVLITGESNGLLFVLASNNQLGIDTSFGGGDGLVTSALDGASTSGHSIVLDATGRILIAGRVDSDVFVLRLNADGSFDSTFNTTGFVRFTRPGNQDEARVLPQFDGSVVITFSTDEAGGALAVARLDGSGLLDAAFGSSGVAQLDAGAPVDADILVDGRIVVATMRAGMPAVARILADGTPDDTMGPGGYATIPLGAQTTVDSLTVTSTGFLLLGGTQQVDSGSAWTIYGVVARVWN